MATSGWESSCAFAIPSIRLIAPGPSVARHTPGLPVSAPYVSAMNAAPRSSRVVTNRIDESTSASTMWRFSSPGRPNTNSTPSFSRHSTIIPCDGAVMPWVTRTSLHAGCLEHLSRELGVRDVLAQVLHGVDQRPGRRDLFAVTRILADRPGVERRVGVQQRAAVGGDRVEQREQLVGTGDRWCGTPTGDPAREAAAPAPRSATIACCSPRARPGRRRVRVVAGGTPVQAHRPDAPTIAARIAVEGPIDEARARPRSWDRPRSSTSDPLS